MKNLIIAGPEQTGKTEAAQSVLQIVPSKYTTRLNTDINSVFLSRFRELPYLRIVLFDGVGGEEEILKLTKLVGMYAPKCALIFTTNVNPVALSKDDRFNVITMLP